MDKKEYVINPLTKRQILVNGSTYKKLVLNKVIQLVEENKEKRKEKEKEKGKEKEKEIGKEKEKIILPIEIKKYFTLSGEKQILDNEKWILLHNEKKTKYLLDVFNQGMTPRIVKELDVQVRFNHPNLVIPISLYMSDEKNSKVCKIYRIIPFFDKTLKDVIKVSEREILEILYQLLCVLNYLHEQFLILVNINRKNIYTTSYIETGKTRWYPRLSDFKDVILLPHETLDTQHFFHLFEKIPKSQHPPEISNNTTFNEKIDIWTLGIVIYELISGKTFKAIDNLHSFIKNKKMLLFLEKMFQQDPLKRPSAKELLDDEIFNSIMDDWEPCSFEQIKYKNIMTKKMRLEAYSNEYDALYAITKKYNLMKTTWFLAVHISDEFHAIMTQEKANEQYVSYMTCLLLACYLYDEKFSEEDIIDILKLQERPRSAFPVLSREKWLQKIEKMKCFLLKELKFRLWHPTIDFRFQIQSDKIEKIITCLSNNTQGICELYIRRGFK